MTKIQEIIETVLESVKILMLSQETEFIKRAGGKIQGLDFVLSFFSLLQMNQEVSLNNWSTALSFRIEDTVSKQALSQKSYDRHVEFTKRLLNEVMSKKTKKMVKTLEKEPGLFDYFNQAFVRDSTCITLNNSLAEAFPSSHRKIGTEAGATARIQAAYDLIEFQYHYFKLASYRDTDAKEAPSIFDYANKGDLIIEDLGYQSFDNYIELENKGIYLVTKWNNYFQRR